MKVQCSTLKRTWKVQTWSWIQGHKIKKNWTCKPCSCMCLLGFHSSAKKLNIKDHTVYPICIHNVSNTAQAQHIVCVAFQALSFVIFHFYEIELLVIKKRSNDTDDPKFDLLSFVFKAEIQLCSWSYYMANSHFLPMHDFHHMDHWQTITAASDNDGYANNRVGDDQLSNGNGNGDGDGNGENNWDWWWQWRKQRQSQWLIAATFNSLKTMAMTNNSSDNEWQWQQCWH